MEPVTQAQIFLDDPVAASAKAFSYTDGSFYDSFISVFYTPGDEKFYADLARDVKGSVLELGCGTGRITIPMAATGAPVTAVDRSLPMLKSAIHKSRQAGLEVDWVLQDILTLNLDMTFDVVCLPFNSLHYFKSKNDFETALTKVSEHMNSESRFVFDVFNPLVYKDVEDPKMKAGPSPGVGRIDWYGSKPAARRAREMNYFSDYVFFYPDELEYVLEKNHFKIIEKHGDFLRKPFSEKDAYQIVTCEKIKR
jgi:SAM-dependent methyltransferase